MAAHIRNTAGLPPGIAVLDVARKSVFKFNDFLTPALCKSKTAYADQLKCCVINLLRRPGHHAESQRRKQCVDARRFAHVAWLAPIQRKSGYG